MRRPDWPEVRGLLLSREAETEATGLSARTETLGLGLYRCAEGQIGLMEKRWYVIRTSVGQEKGVKARLARKIREKGMEDAFGQILIPTERVMTRVRGKQQVVERTLYPGYLLVEMALNEETWHLVHSVPRVAGFVGEARAPAAVPEREIAEIIKLAEEAKTAVRPRVVLSVGDKVKVIDGPFRDFTGTVEDIKPESSRVRVSLSVFGRPTPVELDILQVEAA